MFVRALCTKVSNSEITSWRGNREVALILWGGNGIWYKLMSLLEWKTFDISNPYNLAQSSMLVM